MSGCATQPQYRSAGSRIDSKYGVSPSPRVVADGEPVPKGGGTALIGKPYTIAGRTYYPSDRPGSEIGLASWYGSDFHGRRTANGEIFDRMALMAAHPTMPLPSYARVTNLRNNRSIIVRVNDRGPYHENRVMDVSEQVASALDFRQIGTTRVRVDYVSRASLAGSDDSKLLATLRMDGGPASLNVARADTPTETRVREPEQIAARPTRIASAKPSALADTEEEKSGRLDPRAMPHAPMRPPTRPLDLGTVPGAGIPIAAPRPTKPIPKTISALLTETDPRPPRR